jgi:hypothetical protein
MIGDEQANCSMYIHICNDRCQIDNICAAA